MDPEELVMVSPTAVLEPEDPMRESPPPWPPDVVQESMVTLSRV